MSTFIAIRVRTKCAAFILANTHTHTHCQRVVEIRLAVFDHYNTTVEEGELQVNHDMHFGVGEKFVHETHVNSDMLEGMKVVDLELGEVVQRRGRTMQGWYRDLMRERYRMIEWGEKTVVVEGRTDAAKSEVVGMEEKDTKRLRMG